MKHKKILVCARLVTSTIVSSAVSAGWDGYYYQIKKYISGFSSR